MGAFHEPVPRREEPGHRKPCEQRETAPSGSGPGPRRVLQDLGQRDLLRGQISEQLGGKVLAQKALTGEISLLP